jgi:Na+/H+ antiporter NhaD/arsenite permease-like protein
MIAAGRYRYTPALVMGVITVAAVWAMFSGSRQDVPVGEQGKAAWLGADLAPGSATPSPGVRGVRITRVWSRSPARAAGLASGDVILEMNAARVFTPADVEAMLSAPGVRQPLELVVLRNGQRASVSVIFQETPDFTRNIGVTLLLLAVVFTLLYATSLDRVTVVGCGAVLSIILGTGLGFYDQQSAFGAIRMGTLALLLGMGLITVALEETGAFAIVARKVGELSRGDWSRMMVLLCVATYLLSMFVNNLTTILVILPLTLSLARDLGFDPRPFVIGEIVSSNLGGASSMIGDFPNMLIASETTLQFHDFLLYMMPPCLVLLAITVWLLRRMRPNALSERGGGRRPATEATTGTEAPPLVRGKMKPALAVLAVVIVAFFLCGTVGVRPATVALGGGFTILLLWNRAVPRLLGKAGFGDILFFAGLFVLVGCAQAAGLLDTIATWIVGVSGGGLVQLALVLMWVAAIVTTFLNAGPTTALFAPIVTGLGVSAPNGLLWWALSLGVCAGSSATITGATAGPVALTKLEEFVKGLGTRVGSEPVTALSFVDYAKVGVPLMFVFLLVSSVYIWGLSVWS